MQAFEYAAPQSAEEVVKLLAGKNGDAASAPLLDQ